MTKWLPNGSNSSSTHAGRLPGFPDVESAVAATRIIMMGWGVENFIQESEGERLLAAVRVIFAQFDHGNAPRRQEPA